jgi:hypothetical protein
MCCCVSDQCTKRLVAGLGVCVALLGVIAFAFSINMVVQTGWLREAHGSGLLYNFQVWMTIILFVTSFVLTMMGGLSFAANYIQKGVCTFCYGMWLAILILTLGSISLPILTVYNMTPQNIESFCKNDYTPPMALFTPLVKEAFKQADDLDNRIKEAMDKTMCRKICPCTDLGKSVG